MAQDGFPEDSLAGQEGINDFLFDDGEQMMEGTPLSPQFNPDVLEPRRYTLTQPTQSVDRPIEPRPAPPRPIPRLGPATRPAGAADFTNTPGARSSAFASSLRFQPARVQAQDLVLPQFVSQPGTYRQPGLVPQASATWNSTPTNDEDGTGPSPGIFKYNTTNDFISPDGFVTSQESNPFDYSWPDASNANITGPPSSSLLEPGPWKNLDDDDDDDDDDDNDDGDDQDEQQSNLMKKERGEEEKGNNEDTGFSSSKRARKNRTGGVGRQPNQSAAPSPTATTHTQNFRARYSSKSSDLTTTASASASVSPLSTRLPSKLRSASRTSKNTHHKPAETAEERRTRASHNMVEKQYRNRLNTQFENLLNALPEQLKGGGDGEDSDPPLDFTDKRVSKAEVLDMARRHIKALEKERDALEREKAELLGAMEKLREAYRRAARDFDDDDMAGGAAAAPLV